MGRTVQSPLAGLASLVIPGAGQALQQRIGRGAMLLVLGASLWWFFQLGYLVHLWAALDAALHRRP